jgi:serine phosphatase RsbU (regulator of sigma subunit)
MFNRLRAFLVGLTPMGRQIRRMGRWLESELLASARHRAEQTAQFSVRDDDAVVCEDCPETPDPPEPYRLVGRMLRNMGVARVELSVRLDANQIANILTHLSICRGLNGGGAVQCACTKTSIVDGLLAIDYSYCTTRFSRFVHWYKARQRRFSDHRALFQAAPKYTLLAAILAATPPIVYSLMESWTVLIALTLAAVGAISLLVYGFFMTVGSVEYDNEEQAERLRRANSALEAYAMRTRADLGRAREVQQMLLPDSKHMPMPDKLNWASSFAPETEVGGDYFDAAALDDHRVAIIFTDVSGHGMSAAFITAIVKTAFQRWADDGGCDIQLFVTDLNSTLYRMTPDDSFAASFIAVYDSADARLDYINCGHSPEPWIVPGDSGQAIVSLDDARAILLGVLPEFTSTLQHKPLAPGDKLIFATDGLTEALNIDAQQFGLDRLADLISDSRQYPPAKIVARIVREVSEFSAGTEQYDDQTVLAMEIRPPAPRSFP